MSVSPSAGTSVGEHAISPRLREKRIGSNMIERKQVGKPVMYEGRKIIVRYMGPDLLTYVDDIELGGFYLNSEAAIGAGKRHIDAEIKAEQKR
jgi:hypothetical protein